MGELPIFPVRTRSEQITRQYNVLYLCVQCFALYMYWVSCFKCKSLSHYRGISVLSLWIYTEGSRLSFCILHFVLYLYFHKFGRKLAYSSFQFREAIWSVWLNIYNSPPPQEALEQKTNRLSTIIPQERRFPPWGMHPSLLNTRTFAHWRFNFRIFVLVQIRNFGGPEFRLFFLLVKIRIGRSMCR